VESYWNDVYSREIGDCLEDYWKTGNQ